MTTAAASSVRANGSSNSSTRRRLWIFLVWIVGVSWFPPTAECFVTHVMRSFLWQQRRSLWSATTSRFFYDTASTLPTNPPSCFSGVAAASSPSSAQSYFDRHSRLFTSSSVISSASSMGTNDGDENSTPSPSDDRTYSDYEKWVRRLYMTNMFHPVKMGLTNMQHLHDIMGNPMDDVSFHCAEHLC